MFDKDTVDYYDSHYDIVYHNYEKAVLSELHDYLLKVFPEKKSAILDIGAGTGRDMRFLLKKGYDVYGRRYSAFCGSDAILQKTENFFFRLLKLNTTLMQYRLSVDGSRIIRNLRVY